MKRTDQIIREIRNDGWLSPAPSPSPSPPPSRRNGNNTISISKILFNVLLSISCNLDNQSVANQDLSPIRSPRRPPLSLSPGLGLDDHGNQTNRHGSPIRRQISRSRQSSPESRHSRRSVSFILLRYLAIATEVLLSYRQGVSSHTWTIGDSSSAKF